MPGPVHAYCVGALVSSQNVHLIAAYLRERASGVPVVVDPVMSASLGGELSAGDALEETLLQDLLTLPVIVTPNLNEVRELLDIEVRSQEDMIAAGERFLTNGARAAVIKGGHLRGEPVDVLLETGVQRRYGGNRLPGPMRGGGSTFAAALACSLARGKSIEHAVEDAHGYVRRKIAARTMRGGLQVAF